MSERPAPEDLGDGRDLVGGRVALAGWGLHIPGFDPGELTGHRDSSPCCPPERAHELLGKKGLLGKEPATRLALCAVHRALGLPPGERPPAGPAEPRTAVVVSSNFGNVATVRDIARIVRRGSVREVSPLDAPNTSSNVIASTIAIRFRFGGPNLMVCSGTTSGLDAVALARLLLRAGRADRVVVVGAEPDDPVASRLNERRAARPRGAGPLRAAAAAAILVPAAADAPGLTVVGPVRWSRARPDFRDPVPASVFIGPREIAPGAVHVLDLTGRIGDTYGALGVLQLAIGAALVAASPGGRTPVVAVACGDLAEGWRSALVSDGSLPAIPLQGRGMSYG
jgi:3-oxoacyl-[acyl-carrier-protein] synthase II